MCLLKAQNPYSVILKDACSEQAKFGANESEVQFEFGQDGVTGSYEFSV